MVRSVVLGLLRGGGRLHGYALVRAYRELTGVQLNSGNFYRELSRLAAEGLVEGSPGESGEDARRVHYEITTAGAAAFDAWFVDPRSSGSTGCDEELALRAAFAAQVSADAALRVLGRWREELWFRSQVLERERDAALERRRGVGDEPFPARASLLARRLRHVVADLEFLDEFRKTYERWQAARSLATQRSAVRDVRAGGAARRLRRRA